VTDHYKDGGKPRESKTVRRCLPPDEMSEVEALLKGAPWKASKRPTTAPCNALPKQSTAVKIYGKQVVVESDCPVTVLDGKSKETLRKLKSHLPNILWKECLDNPLAKGCD